MKQIARYSVNIGVRYNERNHFRDMKGTRMKMRCAKQWIASAILFLVAIAAFGQKSVDETLIVNNSTGTIKLQWRPIDPRSELIVGGGRLLTPNTDYQINYAFGLIQLSQVIKRGESIRVSYTINPKQASRNDQPIAIPLEFNLVNRGSGSLAFAGIYNAGEGQNGTTMLGLKGGLKLSETWGLTGNLWVDNPAAGNVMSQTAMKFGLNGKMAGAKLDFGYVYGGEGLTHNQAIGVNKGLEKFNASLAWDQAKNWKAGVYYKQSDALSNSLESAREIAANFGTILMPGLILDYSHKMNWNGDEQATVTDSAKTSLSVGNTKINVNWGQSQIGSTVSSLTDAKLETGGPSAKINAHYRSVIDPAGTDQLNSDIRAALIPMRGVRVEGSYAELVNSSVDRRQLYSGKLFLEPFVGISLAAGMSVNNGPQLINVQTIETKLNPSRYFEVSGSAHRYILNENEKIDAIAISTRMKPLRPFSIYGTYNEHPDDTGMPMEISRRTLGGEVRMGSMSISGAYRYQEDLLSQASQWGYEFSSKLFFAKSTLLNMSYVRDASLLNILNGSTIYKLQFSHQLGMTSLSLEGFMKQYDMNGLVQTDKNEYQARANLSIKY